MRSGNKWQLLKWVMKPGVEKFVVPNLERNRTYHFRVFAVKKNIKSERSNEASATTKQ
jgi:hypothetical protein